MRSVWLLLLIGTYFLSFIFCLQINWYSVYCLNLHKMSLGFSWTKNCTLSLHPSLPPFFKKTNSGFRFTSSGRSTSPFWFLWFAILCLGVEPKLKNTFVCRTFDTVTLVNMRRTWVKGVSEGIKADGGGAGPPVLGPAVFRWRDFVLGSVRWVWRRALVCRALENRSFQ